MLQPSKLYHNAFESFDVTKNQKILTKRVSGKRMLLKNKNMEL